MKAQKYFAILLVSMVSMLHGRSILEDSLDDFLHRVAQEEEKVEFRGYYSQFLEGQSRSRRNSKQRHLRRIRAVALRKVREEHPEWYKEIEPYALDLDEPTPEARKVRLFLTRFALLENYRQEINPSGLGWWDTTKVYFKGMRNKLANLKDRALGRKKAAKA